MRISVRQLNRYFALLTAPFIGMMAFMLAADWNVMLPQSSHTKLPQATPANLSAPVLESLGNAEGKAATIGQSLNGVKENYAKTTTETGALLLNAQQLTSLPFRIVDARTSALLGTPTRTLSGPNADLALYDVKEAHYRGYALKVTLKTNQAMRMVLGKDQLGSSETTLEAVKRYGASVGVNAGGFADDARTGKRFPLSTTMLDGKYVYGFEPTFQDLFFVGLSRERKLIGGKFSRQSDLDRLQPMFGASFVPILLLDGKKQPIPEMWLHSPRRAPRTVIANYRNDQLLFLVTDGHDESGASGATLPELQDKLIALGVKDAYNLDGGGSSSLIWGTDIVNRPSDGRLRSLATHFLLFR